MQVEVGAVVEGTVTGITKFGAFVSLPDGKSGLVHISEIANTYVSDVNEFLKLGDKVKVRVLAVTPDGKINLSIKQVAPPPQRGPRPSGGGRPSQGGGRPMGFVRPAPKEPSDFEDRLKQFMQSSDSKLSELRYIEKKGGNRRGGGRR